jgi:hypothetical protein
LQVKKFAILKQPRQHTEIYWLNFLRIWPPRVKLAPRDEVDP